MRSVVLPASPSPCSGADSERRGRTRTMRSFPPGTAPGSRSTTWSDETCANFAQGGDNLTAPPRRDRRYLPRSRPSGVIGYSAHRSMTQLSLLPVAGRSHARWPVCLVTGLVTNAAGRMRTGFNDEPSATAIARLERHSGGHTRIRPDGLPLSSSPPSDTDLVKRKPQSRRSPRPTCTRSSRLCRRGSRRARWMGNLTVIDLIDQFETAIGAKLFHQVGSARRSCCVGHYTRTAVWTARRTPPRRPTTTSSSPVT
jgi:hypothetical protein